MATRTRAHTIVVGDLLDLGRGIVATVTNVTTTTVAPRMVNVNTNAGFFPIPINDFVKLANTRPDGLM